MKETTFCWQSSHADDLAHANWRQRIFVGNMSRMSKRDRKAYFKTFELTNGTALLAIPMRKPHPKSVKIGISRMDEDGVCWVFTDDYNDIEGYTQETRNFIHSTLATSINVKRAIRQQVEPKLDAPSRNVAALKDQVARIEQKLDSIVSPKPSGRNSSHG